MRKKDAILVDQVLSDAMKLRGKEESLSVDLRKLWLDHRYTEKYDQVKRLLLDALSFKRAFNYSSYETFSIKANDELKDFLKEGGYTAIVNEIEEEKNQDKELKRTQLKLNKIALNDYQELKRYKRASLIFLALTVALTALNIWLTFKG